jgi:hypothetical protein
MIVLSVHGNDWSDITTKTTQIVQKTIENLKNTHVDDLEDYGYEFEDGIYTNWYLEDVYDIEGLKQVTVYVYWHDSYYRPNYTSTSTYFQPKE